MRERWLPPIDRVALVAGYREMRTVAVAIAVWGVVTGVAMVRGGLSAPWAAALSIFAFAGSAQLAVLPLLITHTPLPIVWVTALLVNLRFVIAGAASRRFFIRLPWRQRLVCSYFNSDLGFAMFMRRFGDTTNPGTAEHYGHFWGFAATNWVSWHVSSLLGIAIAGFFPTSWGLEFVAVIALFAVLIPLLTRMPAVAGVVVTGVLSVVFVGWPMRLGLLASVLAGVATAVGLERLPWFAGPLPSIPRLGRFSRLGRRQEVVR